MKKASSSTPDTTAVVGYLQKIEEGTEHTNKLSDALERAKKLGVNTDEFIEIKASDVDAVKDATKKLNELCDAAERAGSSGDGTVKVPVIKENSEDSGSQSGVLFGSDIDSSSIVSELDKVENKLEHVEQQANSAKEALKDGLLAFHQEYMNTEKNGENFKEFAFLGDLLNGKSAFNLAKFSNHRLSEFEYAELQAKNSYLSNAHLRGHSHPSFMLPFPSISDLKNGIIRVKNNKEDGFDIITAQLGIIKIVLSQMTDEMINQFEQAVLKYKHAAEIKMDSLKYNRELSLDEIANRKTYNEAVLQDKIKSYNSNERSIIDDFYARLREQLYSMIKNSSNVDDLKSHINAFFEKSINPNDFTSEGYENAKGYLKLAMDEMSHTFMEEDIVSLFHDKILSPILEGTNIKPDDILKIYDISEVDSLANDLTESFLKLQGLENDVVKNINKKDGNQTEVLSGATPAVQAQESLQEEFQETRVEAEKTAKELSLLEKAMDMRHRGDITDYDANDYNFSRNMLNQRRKQVEALQKQLDSFSGDKASAEFKSLQDNLEELKIEFLALYSCIEDSFADKFNLTNGQGVNKKVKSLYSSIIGEGNQTPLSLYENTDGQLSFIENAQKAVNLIEDETGQMLMFETASEKATDSAIEGQMTINDLLDKNIEGQMTLNDLVEKHGNISSDATPDVKGHDDIQEEFKETREEAEKTEQAIKDVTAAQSSIQDQNGVLSGTTAQADAHMDNAKAISEEVNATEKLVKTIKDLSDANEKSKRRPEQAFIANLDTGYVSPVITSKYGNSVNMGQALKNATSTVNATFHSHPEDMAALSPGDVRSAFARLSDNILYSFVVGMEEVAIFDASKVKTEDQDKILKLFTENLYKKTEELQTVVFNQFLSQWDSLEVGGKIKTSDDSSISDPLLRCCNEAIEKVFTTYHIDDKIPAEVKGQIESKLKQSILSTVNHIDGNSKINHSDIVNPIFEELKNTLPSLIQFNEPEKFTTFMEYLEERLYHNLQGLFSIVLSPSDSNFSNKKQLMVRETLESVLSGMGYNPKDVYRTSSINDYLSSGRLLMDNQTTIASDDKVDKSASSTISNENEIQKEYDETSEKAKELARQIAALYKIRTDSKAFENITAEIKEFLSILSVDPDVENPVQSIAESMILSMHSLKKVLGEDVVNEYREMIDMISGNIKLEGDMQSSVFGKHNSTFDQIKKLFSKATFSKNGTVSMEELLPRFNERFGANIENDGIASNILSGIVEYIERAKETMFKSAESKLNSDGFYDEVNNIFNAFRQTEAASESVADTFVKNEKEKEQASTDSTNTIINNERKQQEEQQKTADKEEQATKKKHNYEIIKAVRNDDGTWSDTYQDGIGRTFEEGERKVKGKEEPEYYWRELTNYKELEKEAVKYTNQLALAYADLEKEQRKATPDTYVLQTIIDQIDLLESRLQDVKDQAMAYDGEKDPEYDYALFEKRVSKDTDEYALKLQTKTAKEIRQENEANLKLIERKNKELEKSNSFLSKQKIELRKIRQDSDSKLEAKKGILNNARVSEADKKTLQDLYDKVNKKINDYETSNHKLSRKEKDTLLEEIADLKLKKLELQNKYYGSTSLSPTELDDNKAILTSGYDLLISRAKEAGKYTKDLVKNLEDQKIEIANIKNSNGIKVFTDHLKAARAEFVKLKQEEHEKQTKNDRTYEDKYASIKKYAEERDYLNQLLTEEIRLGKSDDLTQKIEEQTKKCKALRLEAEKSKLVIEGMLQGGAISKKKANAATGLFENVINGRRRSFGVLRSAKASEEKKAKKEQDRADAEAKKQKEKAEKESNAQKYAEDLRQLRNEVEGLLKSLKADDDFGVFESIKEGTNSSIITFIKELEDRTEKTTVTVKSLWDVLDALTRGDFSINKAGDYKTEQIKRTDVENAYKTLVNSEERYLSLLAKESIGTATTEQLEELKKLTAEREKAEAVINKKTAATEAEIKAQEKWNDVHKKSDDLLNDLKSKEEQISDTIKNSNSTLDGFKSKNIEGSESVLNYYQKQVDELNNKLQTGKISIEKYNEEFLTISDKLNSTVIGDVGIDEARDKMNKYLIGLGASKNQIGKFDKTNKTLTATFKNQNGEIEKITLKYDELSKTIRVVSNDVDKAQSGMSKFIGGLKKKFEGIGQYIMMYIGFNDIIRYIREGVTVIKELDVALTEMKKVSDESTESLKNFQKVSFDIAGSIGTTAEQIQNSAADFMRLGFELDVASELARDANVYANVGDMGIEEATEHMVSSIQAWKSEFGNEVDASKAIVDRYNEIGNNFAITSADIGSAMERSAAALKEGGNTLNEALGLITAGNIIQQDADTTANALKILSLRIRGSKTQLEEMGESTDDLASSTSKLREEIKALTGVDIMEDEDTYKSTAKIIQEIGENWEKLSDVSQAAALEKLAGKNRASVVAGLLENYKVIGEVIESAENADGSAMEENLEYMDSIAGKTQLLTNKVQEFWYNLIDSETAKGVLDFLIKLMDGVIDLTDTLGETGTALVAFMGGSAIKNLLSKDGGGRAKEFALIINMPPNRLAERCAR